MAAPTQVQIMQAIQIRLATITGLRSRTDLFIPAQVTPPQAVIWMPVIEEYHAAFNKGLMHLTCQIHIITGTASDRAGQTALTTYTDAGGSKSVPVAIEADKTLGGVVSDCIVLRSRPTTVDEINALGYYGAILDLQIYAPGS
jgi:hypothetical protein